MYTNQIDRHGRRRQDARMLPAATLSRGRALLVALLGLVAALLFRGDQLEAGGGLVLDLRQVQVLAEEGLDEDVEDGQVDEPLVAARVIEVDQGAQAHHGLIRTLQPEHPTCVGVRVGEDPDQGRAIGAGPGHVDDQLPLAVVLDPAVDPHAGEGLRGRHVDRCDHQDELDDALARVVHLDQAGDPEDRRTERVVLRDGVLDAEVAPPGRAEVEERERPQLGVLGLPVDEAGVLEVDGVAGGVVAHGGLRLSALCA